MSYQDLGNCLTAMFDEIVLDLEKIDRAEIETEQEEKSILEELEELEELKKEGENA